MSGGGIAGGLAGPASLPRTPHHLRRGAAIDELIRSLEAEWRIGLKVRGAEWSPRRISADDLADKIYGLIQRLFYSAETALHQAIANFNELAPVFPHEERLELLHRTLSSKTKNKGPDSRAGTPRNNPPKGLSSSLIAASHTSQTAGLSRSSHQDERESYYATAPESGSTTEEDEDCFETPPSPTPSSRVGSRRTKASPIFYSASRISRKRPSDSSNDSGNSPKLTKISKGKQAVVSMSGPIEAPSLFKKPSLDMARSFQAASVISSVNTSFNNTVFSSQETNANTVNTSFTSFDGVSDLDIHYPKLTRTISATTDPDKEAFDLEKQREIDRGFSQELSRESNSTFGSIDEDGLVDASCNVEGEARPASVPSLKPAAPTNGRQTRSSSTKTGFTNQPRVGDSFPPPGSSSVARSPAKSMSRTRSSPVGVSPLTSFPAPQQASMPTDSPSKKAYYIRELPKQNLFMDPLPDELFSLPFFLQFICCRLSIPNGTLKELIQPMDICRMQTDPDAFWSTLDRNVQSAHREPKSVWAAAKKSFEGYTFKGRVVFNGWSAPSGSVFKLEPMPIEPERSCLFQRMFGSDRFLYLTFPSFSEDKPERFTVEQMQQIEEEWKLWILETHSFLGRNWRVFYMEPIKRKNNTRKDDSSDKRVILFATEGVGIERPMSVGGMLNEFMPLEKNQKQNFGKAFSRLALGLSRTIPTLTFKPSQLIRIRDTLADGTSEASEFNDHGLDWREQCEKKPVMDDGCARMSVGAALKIWELYQSATGSDEPLPSAFQGRIGGAKGMWMISGEPHTRNQTHLDIWIEITDSQLKFEPTEDDEDDDRYNHHRLTFNYVNHSFVNGSTDLHISFIPILADRGVKRDIIANLMISRLDEERKQLLEMLHNPVRLHNWITKQGSATPALGILPWQAALPLSIPEKAKLLLRTGFTPAQSPYLVKTLKRFIRQRQTWMEQKLRAPLGKATILMGLADPENVLKPGEVHIQFSSPFVDEFTKKTYRHLNELEVLVARQPACRPSDIQKVRAVSHPKLSHLVDVIVFPVQGEFPLAGKLQGGDYDGDTFWTCWENDLVEPFLNAPAPRKTPDPAKYGISKDTRQLRQVMNPRDLSTADNFLKEALNFRTLRDMLGKATNFLEKVAYRENQIFSERINALCDVHDLLVDAPKQAYRFNESDFNKLVRHQLKCGNPKVPAYKQAMEASAKSRDMDEGEKDPVKDLKHRPSNILDYLYFDIVRKHNTETRRLLKTELPKEEDDDPELQLPFHQLRDKDSDVLTSELNNLLAGIQKIVQDWNRSLGDKSDLTPDKYNKLLESCYTSFRLLLPSAANASHPDIAPLICHYLGPKHPTTWEYIRASALYTTYPTKHAFVWHMAGRELAKLKASGDPDTYDVVPGIFADLKTKPNKVPKPENEESEDEFESVIEQITG